MTIRFRRLDVEPGAFAPALLFCWGLLVLLNYLPASTFPPGWALKAVSWQGLPIAAEDLLGAAWGHAKVLAAAVLVLLAASGFGERLRVLAGARRDFLLASLPFGLVVLALLGLGLGLAGLLFRSVAIVIVAAGLACGGMIPGRGIGVPGMTRPLKLLAFGVAVPALFGALVPEVTYDALAYHVGAPELYLKMHRIVRLEHMFFTDLPMALQMPYMFTAALGAADGAGAKVVHWLLGMACAAVALRLGSLAAPRGRNGFPHSGAWTTAFLLATPFLATQMMRANVDLGVMFFVSAGAYHLMAFDGGARAAFMTGLCFGAAASVKLTGGYGLVAAALVLVAGRASARSMILFFSGAAVPLAPWLVKSALLCGNPVYPFLWSVLGGSGWGSENAAIYRSDMTGPTSFNVQYPGLLSRMAGPWLMVMHDRGGEAALGPFALWLIPALAIVRVAPRAARAAGFLLAFWLLWFMTARDPRFFLPAWPVACAIAAQVLCGLTGVSGRTARWTCAAVLVLAPFFSASVAYRTLNPGPVVWGAVSRDMYRDRLIPPSGRYASIAHATNRLVAAKERVLVIGDVKGAMLTSVSVYPSMFDTPHLTAWLRESGSARRLRVKMHQAGIGAIIHNVEGAIYLRDQFGHFAYSGRQRAVLEEFWGGFLSPLREVDEGGGVVMGLYRLRGTRGEGRMPPLPGGVR